MFLTKFFNKILPKKLGNRVAIYYENWIIPPQNESLIELKRKEFKEKTKFLDPKILYSLSEEEKNDLRDNGYFVDLDKKTIDKINFFKLTQNRHFGKYRIQTTNYNFAIYNTRYYYVDQEHITFYGDPQYFNKMWRKRTPTKRRFLKILILVVVIYIHYFYKLKRHQEMREKSKKYNEMADKIEKMRINMREEKLSNN
jgi:hypothetical protein